MDAKHELKETSDDFPELDKELQMVSDAVAGLYDINPAAVTDALNALQHAQGLTSSLASELKSLAKEANEPEPDWTSREEFSSQRKRLATLVNSRTKMFERAIALVETLASLLGGVAVRHRLPSRSVTLTELAHRAANELREHASDLTAIVANRAPVSPPSCALLSLSPAWSRTASLREKFRPRCFMDAVTNFRHSLTLAAPVSYMAGANSEKQPSSARSSAVSIIQNKDELSFLWTSNANSSAAAVALTPSGASW